MELYIAQFIYMHAKILIVIQKQLKKHQQRFILVIEQNRETCVRVSPGT